MTIEQFKGLVADLARPFAVISTSAAASWAIVDIGSRITDGNTGSMFIGVVLGGVSAIYIGKAFENTRIAGHTAEVEKVRAQASPPPAEALRPPDPPPLPADAGELPLDQRVTP